MQPPARSITDVYADRPPHPRPMSRAEMGANIRWFNEHAQAVDEAFAYEVTMNGRLADPAWVHRHRYESMAFQVLLRQAERAIFRLQFVEAFYEFNPLALIRSVGRLLHCVTRQIRDNHDSMVHGWRMRHLGKY